MFTLTEAEKTLAEELKETQEWVTFLTHVEEITIKVFTDVDKKAWYLELVEVVTKVISECSQELMDAVSGSSTIPAEWKAASATQWVTFALKSLVLEGKIIAGIWLPAPASPTA